MDPNSQGPNPFPGGFRLSPEDLDRLATQVRSIGTAVNALRPNLEQMRAAAVDLGARVREAGHSDTEPPTDPRARALWARQHRNTGPARDPFARRGRSA